MNYAGVITALNLFPGREELGGHYISQDPVPDDGVYGTATEHLAILEAVDRALTRCQRSFSALELGAAWGPWVSLAGVLCNRLDFKQTTLCAIEADPAKFNSLTSHLALNGLVHDEPKGRKIILHCGAAWHETTILSFPKIAAPDMGAAATSDIASSIDYRGFNVEMFEVPALSLEDICSGIAGPIDIAHWDVQGAEWPIAEASMEFINAKFRSLQVGTHSRLIEGQLLSLLHANGWDVIREVPCQMRFNRTIPSLEGMTTSDGEIYAQNPRLW